MLPTELIIANVLHKIAGNAVRVDKLMTSMGVTESQIMEAVARDILAHIANQARLDLVLKAIAAAGGPADAGELSARFKAVQEMHKSESTRT